MAAYAASAASEQPSRIRARLLGHQGRCFDIRCSGIDSNMLLSASEDGTGKLWDLDKRKCLYTMTHNPSSEVLRSVFMGRNVCLAGSDGNISVWNCEEAMSTNASHPSAMRSTSPMKRFQHATEYSQIYVCEPSPHCATELLSGADNAIYLWDLQHEQQRFSFTLEPLAGDRKAFGGARNATGDVFVFDAKWCPSVPYVIAAAASDATVRLLDFRSLQTSSLSSSSHMSASSASPPTSTQPRPSGSHKAGAALILDLAQDGLGHATSVHWGVGDSAHLLSVSFGMGCVALFDLRKGADCLALNRVHEGACYGAMFYSHRALTHGICSYSSDASIKLWDYSSLVLDSADQGREQEPSLSLRSRIDVSELSEILTCCSLPNAERLLVCGGASASVQGKGMSAFLGTPLLVLEPGIA